jgi:hypothetical protein
MTNDPNKSSKRDVAPRYSDPFSARVDAAVMRECKLSFT